MTYDFLLAPEEQMNFVKGFQNSDQKRYLSSLENMLHNACLNEGHITHSSINLALMRRTHTREIGGILEIRNSTNGPYKRYSKYIPLPVPESGIIEEAARTNKRIYVQNTRESELFKNDSPLDKTKTELAIPVTYDGSVIGVLDFNSEEVNAFSDNMINTIETLVIKSAPQIKIMQLIMTSQFDSLMVDSLSRNGFFEGYSEVVDHAISYQMPLTLIYADIDNLKGLNDRYGHNKVDEMFEQFSAKIYGLIRRGDLVGRLSGDELAFLFVNHYLTSNTTSIIDKIRLAGKDILPECVTLSGGGITTKNASTITSINEIRAICDRLLMTAKETKNQYRIITDETFKLKDDGTIDISNALIL